MASPLVKFPINRSGSTVLSGSKLASEIPVLDLSEDSAAASSIDSIPCVFYDCNLSLELIYLSPNALELLGIEARQLIGHRALWDERLLPEDLSLLCEKIGTLKDSGSASMVHRVIDDQGLPLWVCHSFRRIRTPQVIRGCLVPLGKKKPIEDVQQDTIASFIHKLGNHFQLLNLVINSLRKNAPESRETAVLEQTVDNAIELTRIFSDYCQSATWGCIVDPGEIIKAAAATQKASFAEKNIIFEERLDESLRGIMIQGDSYLLELAVAGILKNAFEATVSGGTVALQAIVDSGNNQRCVIRIKIRDAGAGIDPNDLEQVAVPFFTSKKDHDGLGLSMAMRIIELHGGLLTVKSIPGQGTEVNITLPGETSKQLIER